MLLLGGVIPPGEKKMGGVLTVCGCVVSSFWKGHRPESETKTAESETKFLKQLLFFGFCGRLFFVFGFSGFNNNLIYSILVAPAKAPRPVRNFSTVLMGIWFEVAWNIKPALQLDSTALRLHIWVILEGYPTNIIGWKIHLYNMFVQQIHILFFPFSLTKPELLREAKKKKIAAVERRTKKQQ